MFVTGFSSATCYSTDSSYNKQNLLLCEVITSNNTIIVRNLCQVQTCGSGSWVYFRMYEDFIQNYYYVVTPLNSTTDSMLVRTTTSDGYFYIDQTNTGLFITPDLQPATHSLFTPSTW